MNSSPDENDPAHWKDLSDQLGVEATDDLLDYFGGTASVENAEEMEKLSIEPADSPAEPVEIAAAAEPPAVKGEEETKAPATTSQVEIEKRSEKPKRRKSSKREKPRRASEPEQEAAASESSGDDNWAFLASSLGIEAEETPPADPTGSAQSESDAEEAESVEATDSPGELVAEAVEAVSVDLDEEPSIPFPAAIAEESDQPAGDQSVEILNQMFQPREVAADEFGEDLGEEPVEAPEAAEDDAAKVQGDVVEFEVEDLYTESDDDRVEATPRRERKPRPKRSREGKPARQKRSESRDREDEGRSEREPKRRTRTKSAASAEGEGEGTKKERRFPTWNEAVSTIIDGNMTQRKKAKTQRRGRRRRD